MEFNPQLGLEIHRMLVKKGLETPFKKDYLNGWLNDPDRQRLIEEQFKSIMQTLGLNLDDDSLKDSPKRVAKMFTQELFSGCDYANFPNITSITNKIGYDEMIIENGIAVKSFCEHHFITIDGTASVAYIPAKKVAGLSKLNRIVDFFSRRPQVQERLTEQIHATLCHVLETDNVAVLIKAIHYCVKHRGIEDMNCTTTTSKLSGLFKQDGMTRAEFMNLTNHS